MEGLTRRLDQHAPAVFVMPAVLVVLAMSIFPLIVSLYLSLARFRFVKGGFELRFIGWLNYKKLLFGSEQFHFLGDFGQLRRAGLGGARRRGPGPDRAAGALRAEPTRSRSSAVLRRFLVAALAWLGLLLILVTNTGGGHPGSLVVTLFYVGIGVAVQYIIGLGLALLCTQNLPGRTFFRVVFFLPMMITPVGIAYTFRMLTDTTKGPFSADLAVFRLGRDLLGGRSLGGAHGGHDRRRLAVDPVHVHRAAGRDREPAAGPARGGPGRRRLAPADLPLRHLARDPAGLDHGRDHPRDRGVQDRRPAERA